MRESGRRPLKAVEPIHTVELFPPLSRELVAVLKDLAVPEWARPTACTGWTVKDVVAHLLGGNFGRLWDDASRPLRGKTTDETYAELVVLINQRNEEWVRAARRISPGLLIELIELTDRQVYERFRALDGMHLARISVAWAGPGPAPNWFDIAREYTEKWLHQQHIREAVGRPLLTSREWLYPVLDTFVRGLTYTYRDVEAAEGISICLRITGEAGGEWSLRREGASWQLYLGADPDASSVVSIGQDIAWRAFTKGVQRENIMGQVQMTGDARLGVQILDLVSIMA